MGLIQKLNAVATAISNKTGEPASEYTLDEMPEAIASIQTTPLPEPEDGEDYPVRFIGDKGRVVGKLTYAQAAALTSLPEGPEEEGLTFIGWTSSLEAIHTVAWPNRLDVGAMYQDARAENGETILTVCPQMNSDRKITLRFSQSEVNGVEIDWGDGSEPETIATTGNVTAVHTYTETLAKRYDIILAPTESCDLTLGTNSSTNLFGGTGDSYELKKASVGRAHLSKYVFSKCKALRACYLLPQDQVLPDYAFGTCFALQSIVIPNSMTSTGGSIFTSCQALESVVIPNSVTSIGGNFVSQCFSLKTIAIPNSVNSIGSYAFSSCNSLENVVVPNSVTTISASFVQSCYALRTVFFPNSVTSMGNYVVDGCYSAEKIIFDNRTADLPSATWFSTSDKVEVLDFLACEQIPAIKAPGVLSNLPAHTAIVVPDALYNDWIAAANWSAKASQIVKASEYYGGNE